MVLGCAPPPNNYFVPTPLCIIEFANFKSLVVFILVCCVVK